MQATTDTVIVRGPDGEPKTFEGVTTLMGNLGLFIKSEESVEMYVWENVLYMKWTDLKARESIWEEALAELIADAFEDEWDDDYEDEVPVKAKPSVKEEAKPAAEPTDGDDPDVNPYSS
tara:strand:- start:6489 stop:6845 length:357 start_codon:yes stop_codon:yes gene_type:complete